jgi:imidazolonepropionase-like amidohydrolase
MLGFIGAFSQEWEPINGTRNVSNHYTLFSNANIYMGNDNYLSNSKMLIQKNKIVAVGSDISGPENTIEIDLNGQFIYPSFIELHSDFGIKKGKNKVGNKSPQLENNKKGPFAWNEAVKPEVQAFDLIKYNKETAKVLRKMGFATVLSHQQDGIIRGTSTLINLNDFKEGRILGENSAFHYSFYKGSSKQTYPSSLMGIIALIKQSIHDAEWYNQNNGIEFNASLKAINKHATLPQFFDVESELSILRASKIGKEFGIPFIIKGNGMEYKRIEEIKKQDIQLIVPVNYPFAYDVSDPFLSNQLPLSKMKEWELAPYNLFLLDKAEIPFAITSQGLKSEKEFFNNIQKAIDKGLPRSSAIDALSIIPASYLNISDELGSIEKEKIANFIICTDSLFFEKTKIVENWVDGKKYTTNNNSIIDIRGVYSLNIDKKMQFDIEIKGELDKLKGTISTKNEKEKRPLTIKINGNRINLNFLLDEDQSIELAGSISDAESRIWFGKTLLNTKWENWGAIRKNKVRKIESDTTTIKGKDDIAKVYYPNMAYGWDSIPKKADGIVFRNATIWTNEKEGVLKNSDLVIKDGKILMVGYKINLDVMFPKMKGVFEEIDLKGKHLTTGIIDEHSHIGINRGVNESGQAVTSEVSIGDVINSEDINIYRQLAGGVTTSQLLHGSANPIGGQSAIIKLRWGSSPEEMKVEGAKGFIKFALGENVKQSNWGDRKKIRFPQTRMGVEQVFYDAFHRAREYKAGWEIYNSKSKKDQKNSSAPRFDIELNTLAEILDSTRFVTCHSYIQSEINMLMHVADSMGFRINTFTHILEGYKVANKLKAHGAGASTFSDWWAYKFEVNDAIPFNGAMLHNAGVLTGFNSDDAEMGRRLNQEAAKAVKYGGVSEVEAWKFVTLNPAIMLRLDDRLGSIKEGKDADIVIWSDNPLSVYARVEKSYIDGILYFSLDRNKMLEKRNREDRERIIGKMLLEKKKGSEVKPIKEENKLLYECETIEGI